MLQYAIKIIELQMDQPTQHRSSNIKERLRVIHYLISLNVYTIVTYVTISAKTHLVRTTSEYAFNFSALSALSKE